MRVLSLFSGGGLGDLGLELAGMKIVGQVEIEEAAQKRLRLRWPEVPKRKNIKRVKGSVMLRECGPIELISGGFPCQPFSLAGKRKGAADKRNLWPEMFRVISEVRPAWVLAENVPGILGYMESVVLPNLESIGYETLPPLVFPAHALGADHRRDRVWIIAYSASDRRRLSEITRKEREDSPGSENDREVVADAGSSKSRRLSSERRKEVAAIGSGGKTLAHTEGAKREFYGAKPGRKSDRLTNRCKTLADSQIISEREPADEADALARGRQARPFFSRRGWGSVEPGVGRVVNGRTDRVDELKMLGNGQFVYCPFWLGVGIMEFERLNK